MNEKTCSKCRELKPLDGFYKKRDSKDGFQNQCRACIAAHYATNREAIAKSRREHRTINKDRVRAQKAAYYQANREAVLNHNREYYQANREAIVEYQRERQVTHRAQAIQIYGGCCVECGSTDRLEFDHVQNDGKAHRAVEHRTTMLRRIARSGERCPDWELQLLCFGCHRAKTTADQRAA